MRSRQMTCAALILLGCTAAYAEIPGREQTLADDFLGPRIEWEGEIIGSVRDGDDTCFVLKRIPDGFDHALPGEGGRFIACNPGYFDPDKFAPGEVLHVAGNLGAPAPRRIGAYVYDYPVVAGAIIKLSARRPHFFWPPGFYPDPFHPYYDPFWRPWPYRRWP